MWYTAIGQPSSKRQAQSDTIFFGQYYINKGLANLPLISLYDKHTGERLERVENGREYLIELKAGIFDKYEIKMQVLTNGTVFPTNQKNHYRLVVNQTDKLGFMKLRFVDQFKQDKIYLRIREWEDQPETITVFDSVSTMNLSIK